MGQKRVRRQPLDQDDVRDAHGISYYILAGYIEVCPVPISSFRLTYPASHLEAFFGIAIQSNSDRLTAAQAETLDELNKRIKKQLSFTFRLNQKKGKRSTLILSEYRRSKIR